MSEEKRTFKQRVIDLFNNNLIKKDTYDRGHLENLLKTKEGINYNITAFTYNRWNLGMDQINPLLEIVGRGEYKYLGENHDYTGIVSHFPQAGGNEYQIARYTGGHLTFLDPSITSFQQWKESNFQGFPIIGKGTKIQLQLEERVLKVLLSEEGGGSTEGYGHINAESNLGKMLRGRMKGDEFIFNDKKYKILAVD